MDSQRRSSVVVEDGADDGFPSGQTHTTHPPGGDPPGKGPRLFIHCSPDASPLLLYHMFSSYGRIEHLKPLTDRETGLFTGKAFVKFCESSSAQAAKTALHGSVHNNEPMYVQFAQPLSTLRSGQQSFAEWDWPPHSRVFVACAKDLTLLELHNLCKTFGDVQHAVIMTDKNTGESRGVGYVKFDNADAALRAVTTLNSQPGRRVLCRIAQPHWVHAAKSTDPGNDEDGPFTAAGASSERADGPDERMDFGRFLTSILPGGIGGDRGDRGGNLGVPDLRTLIAAVAGGKDAPPGRTPSEEGVPIDLHLHMAEVALKYILGYAHADIAKLKLAELNKLVALINAAASSPPPPPTPTPPPPQPVHHPVGTDRSNDFAQHDHQRDANPSNPGSTEPTFPPGSRLFLRFLGPLSPSDSSLTTFFGQFGPLASAYQVPDRSFGFVQYNDAQSARTALAACTGPFEVAGSLCTVGMANEARAHGRNGPPRAAQPPPPPARATSSAHAGARPDFFPSGSAGSDVERLFAEMQHPPSGAIPPLPSGSPPESAHAAIQGLLQAMGIAVNFSSSSAEDFSATSRGGGGPTAGSSASSSAPMMPRRNDSPILPPAAAAAAAAASSSSSLASPFMPSGGLTPETLMQLHNFVDFITQS